MGYTMGKRYRRHDRPPYGTVSEPALLDPPRRLDAFRRMVSHHSHRHFCLLAHLRTRAAPRPSQRREPPAGVVDYRKHRTRHQSGSSAGASFSTRASTSTSAPSSPRSASAASPSPSAFRTRSPTLSAGFNSPSCAWWCRGDHIRVGSDQGVVTDVGLRHTTIENASGQTVIIPNSVLSKTSLTKLPPANLVVVPFAVTSTGAPACRGRRAHRPSDRDRRRRRLAHHLRPARQGALLRHHRIRLPR